MSNDRTKDPRGRGKKNKTQPNIVEREEYLPTSDSYNDYYEEEPGDIGVASLRKAARYKMIALVVFILAVVSLIGYFFLFQQSIAGKQSQCWAYQQTVEQFAESYLTTNGFSSYPAYIEDIPGFSSIAKTCPDSGSYTWNPVTGAFFCSVHGHYPSNFNKPESVTQSVIQTPTVNENETK